MKSDVNTILSVERLSKQIQTAESVLTLVDQISFTVRQGEVVAILGPSGSGKSTLLGLLAGLDNPTSGDIQLLGQSLSAMDEDQRAALRAKTVGFVFQSFQLLPGLTAMENVMLPLQLNDFPQPLVSAERWLSAVGLAERLNHFPNQLSGGEQQRVALARAFASEPDILFADEPTGNLDTETGEKVIELMFRLREQSNTTLLIVTHDRSLAERCDRSLVMQSGRLEVS